MQGWTAAVPGSHLPLPAMLPASQGKRQDWYPTGPAPSGNSKDILMIYEDDAEEWALYLREIFSPVVKREAILLYCLESFALRHLELLSLNSYKCKILILSDSLCKDLTPKKCQFLEKVLHSSDSVVTLLCGMESSDGLYKSLNIPGSRWEISTEQEPEDYIFVIKGIINGGFEDYLEVSIPTNLRALHSGKGNERKKTDDTEASKSAMPLAVVLPAEVTCENPGEIFILLKDEVIAETLEVEFISHNKHIRVRPAYWSKNVWSLKALDFPAGSVTVHVHCDGIVKATTEIQYCTKATEGPGEILCRNNLEELDGVLTSMLKYELPYCGFRSLQTEICPQNPDIHVKELPTLLHCAAKLGLKRLASHLLQCSGAARAIQKKSMDGSDLAHVAESHGHRELKGIFEDFTIQEMGRNNEQETDYEEDIVSFSTFSPSTQSPTVHFENSKTHRLNSNGAAASERARETKENESCAEETHSPPEIGSGIPENQYDDLYVFIPGIDSENNPQDPLVCCRPPLPPPRAVSAVSQLERPHFSLQVNIAEDQTERNQNWTDCSARQKPRDEHRDEKNKDGKEQEEEDPYTCAEADDNEYDLILSSMSMKNSGGRRSFIINRPPAPTPRPTSILPKEQTTPYIAQVFQQKAARRQSDSDRSYGVLKKPDKARMESPTFSIPRDRLTSGQEELILLQEKVKNGKMSVDEALEKFKHWQIGKSGLEMIQQEKLRQLRDSIIGTRPEEENAYDKLTIVHHPSGNATHNENTSYSIPCSNKLPPRLQVEKEFGFCFKKDY